MRIETVVFGDHHTYTGAGIEHIIRIARGLNASGLVTTEKDAVKLSTLMRGRLETVGPLIIVALETSFFVQGASKEPVGKPARPEVLEELARVSRGQVIASQDVSKILSQLRDLPEPPAIERRLQAL